VHERGRATQPEVQERHQALTARHQLGVAAVAGEEADGLVDRGRRVIVEPRGLHGAPAGVVDARADSISSQSRVGVIGSSVIRTPGAARAWSTALGMTGGTVIERASPRPFEPSGVSGDGEITWAMSMTGASEAVGTR